MVLVAVISLRWPRPEYSTSVCYRHYCISSYARTTLPFSYRSRTSTMTSSFARVLYSLFSEYPATCLPSPPPAHLRSPSYKLLLDPGHSAAEHPGSQQAKHDKHRPPPFPPPKLPLFVLCALWAIREGRRQQEREEVLRGRRHGRVSQRHEGLESAVRVYGVISTTRPPRTSKGSAKSLAVSAILLSSFAWLTLEMGEGTETVVAVVSSPCRQSRTCSPLEPLTSASSHSSERHGSGWN